MMKSRENESLSIIEGSLLSFDTDTVSEGQSFLCLRNKIYCF